MLGSENGSFNVIKYRQGVVQGVGGISVKIYAESEQ